MKMSPVVHFEMPAKDNARASQFYSDAFGWNMVQLGQEMGDYLLAGTTPTDDKQMVTTPGQINGGFFKFKDEEGYNAPHIVIQVENIDEAIEKVVKAGGTKLSEKMNIPGIGMYISAKDTEDNCIGLLQPTNM